MPGLPSFYKHFAGKVVLRTRLTAVGLAGVGECLHTAITIRGECRAAAHGSPELYRLATIGELDRHGLSPGLEDWAGCTVGWQAQVTGTRFGESWRTLPAAKPAALLAVVEAAVCVFMLSDRLMRSN